jgi:hypothetical protein
MQVTLIVLNVLLSNFKQTILKYVTLNIVSMVLSWVGVFLYLQPS